MSTQSAIHHYQRSINTTCLRPGLHAPMIVADYIDSALNVAKYYEKQFNPLLQELYLRRAYNEVINSMCDSLVHNAIRKQCFEQLYKPLLALKRFYKTHHVSNKFVLLEHEVRTLSHEFNQEQL